jgi:hypothetical protein
VSNKAVLIHKDWSQEKKSIFFNGEVFFLLTCPLMDDPPHYRSWRRNQEVQIRDVPNNGIDRYKSTRASHGLI